MNVIEKLLNEPWPPSVEVGREVPEAIAEDDCEGVSYTCLIMAPFIHRTLQECYGWEFGDFPA